MIDRRVHTPRLLWVDIVEKVQNQTSLKISQKPMFRRLGRCNARWSRCKGP
jgi:hypothetical protein